MVTKAEFNKALDSIHSQFDELRTNTDHTLEEYYERQERQFSAFTDQAQARDAQNQSTMVRAIIQQLQLSQDHISLSIREEMNSRFAEMDSKLDQICADTSFGTAGTTSKGKSPQDQVLSTVHHPPHLDKEDLTANLIKKDTRFQIPRADCPGFNGLNHVEWVRKCHSYFKLHQVLDSYKSHLATLQIHEAANDWYDGYLMTHEPPDWDTLVKLVQKRFQNSITLNGFEELKSLNQIDTMHDYRQ
jgi:hypothetical protein